MYLTQPDQTTVSAVPVPFASSYNRLAVTSTAVHAVKTMLWHHNTHGTLDSVGGK
jgi:hypothetical protein